LENVTITRHGNEQAGEYRAHAPGHAETGYLSWVQTGAIRAAEHTVVPPELRGLGIAGHLVDALIADAKAQGFRIRPVCSYVAAAFDKHPEWASLKA
jgi:predicted GNAT family acetyltransferase